MQCEKKKSCFSSCISLSAVLCWGKKKKKEKSLPIRYKHSTYAGGDYEGCEETFDPNSFFWMGIHGSTSLYFNSKDISNLIDLLPCLKLSTSQALCWIGS